MSKPVIGLWGLYAGLLAILVSGCSSFQSPEGSPPSSPPGWPPSSISVVDRTSNSLTIAWGYSSRATSYELLRSSSEEGDYSALASDIATTKFEDQELEPDSVYYYVVRACNKLGCSDASDEIAAGVTESAAAVNIPATPPFIDAREREVFGPNHDEVTWTGVKGATYYEIYRDDTLSATVSAPRTRYAYGDLGRSLGVSFSKSYRVRACNKAGCSPFTRTAYPSQGRGGPSLPATMVGVCEVGLKLKPGEGCQLKDDDTIAYVKAEAHFGVHDICVGTVSARRCTSWMVEINEELIVAELESGKEWLVGRHPMSQLE